MKGHAAGHSDGTDQIGIIINARTARTAPRLRLPDAVKIHGKKAIGILQCLRERPPLAPVPGAL
jgi:hypothetical protein